MALAAALTGCASSAPTTGPAAAPANPAAVDTALTTLNTEISGTVSQRSAGELIHYHVYQDTITACMRAAGFGYTAPAFVDMYAGRTTPLPINDGLGVFAALHPDTLGVTADAVRLAPMDRLGTNPGYTRLSRAGQKRYLTTLQGCGPKTATQDNFPAAWGALDQQLQTALNTVAAQPAVATLMPQSATCMTRAGIPVATVSDLVEFVQAKIGDQTPPASGTAASASWKSAVALDQNAGAADARCRTAARDQALSLAGPTVSAFTATHRGEITLVQQQWNAMLTRARAYPEAATVLR